MLEPRDDLPLLCHVKHKAALPDNSETGCLFHRASRCLRQGNRSGCRRWDGIALWPRVTSPLASEPSQKTDANGLLDSTCWFRIS